MVLLQQLCNIWRIKARQILFIVKQMFFLLLLTHIDVVDFKKKKRAEERAKESQKATEKNYEDYAWKDLCEDPTKTEKAPSASAKQIPQTKHLKSTKNDKVKVITRHWLLQMNPEGTDLLQTRLRETETKLKMNLCLTVITTIAMKTTTVEAEAAVMRRMKMITLTLVIETNRVMSFLPSSVDEEEVESPATTRSGRAITRRSEIDFSFFYFFQRI